MAFRRTGYHGSIALDTTKWDTLALHAAFAQLQSWDTIKLGYACTMAFHCTGYHRVGYHKIAVVLHAASAVVLSTRAFRCTGHHRVGIRLYSMQFPPWQCQPWHLVALDIIELGYTCNLVASAVAATMAFRCTGHHTAGIRLYSMQLPPWQCQPWHFVALDNKELGYVCNPVASAVALAAMAFRRTGYRTISMHWIPKSWDTFVFHAAFAQLHGWGTTKLGCVCTMACHCTGCHKVGYHKVALVLHAASAVVLLTMAFRCTGSTKLGYACTP